MDFAQFSKAVFELVGACAQAHSAFTALRYCCLLYCADQWTPSVDVQQYSSLLNYLHDSVKRELQSNGYFKLQETKKQPPPIMTVTLQPFADDELSPMPTPVARPSTTAAIQEPPPVAVEEAPKKSPPSRRKKKSITVPAIPELKGLPPHTCQPKRSTVPHNPFAAHGGSRESEYCEACSRIAKWDRRRRELLKQMETSGRKPWIGAWAVHPDSYRVELDERNLEDLLPVRWPGDADAAAHEGKAAWKPPGSMTESVGLGYDAWEGPLYSDDGRGDTTARSKGSAVSSNWRHTGRTHILEKTLLVTPHVVSWGL